MSFPFSPVIANIYIERFEEGTPDTAAASPAISVAILHK